MRQVVALILYFVPELPTICTLYLPLPSPSSGGIKRVWSMEAQDKVFSILGHEYDGIYKVTTGASSEPKRFRWESVYSHFCLRDENTEA